MENPSSRTVNVRPEKVAVVDEVREKLSSSSATLLAEYRGLTNKELQALRLAASGAGAEVKVYKNTLVRFAARDLGLSDLDGLLTGPTAVAFVKDDAAAAAKALRDFARTNPLFVVKGGVLGDKVVDAAGARALADLPSRDQLLSQIAGLFAAPAQQMASLLEALPRTFAYGLQALIDKGGADGAPADPEADAAPADEAPADEPAAADEAPAPEASAEGDPAAEPAATPENDA